jgi:deoxyribodipyrimidine photolyase
MKQINERTQLLNDQSVNNDGKYVLYWMQMFKRTAYNYALNFAIEQANLRKIPLVVYEGLKYYYPWANDRIHTFILEGVEEKRKAFAEKGILYLFYLQQDENSPKNVVAEIAKDACLIVTDDFPCFIIPEHNRRIAEKANIPVYAVDSNGMIPMSRFEKEEYAAYTIRPKIKRMLPDYKKPFPEENLIAKADSLIHDKDFLINSSLSFRGLTSAFINNAKFFPNAISLFNYSIKKAEASMHIKDCITLSKKSCLIIQKLVMNAQLTAALGFRRIYISALCQSRRLSKQLKMPMHRQNQKKLFWKS